jgi:hypothetical protein
MVAITLVVVAQWRYELLRNEDIAEFEFVGAGLLYCWFLT